ncbi:histidine phosphatase family protein [Aliiruegeria lutimaris]|uniref:Probable phosphoglycerate mutase n=1 Tax=Aliiruegeria lutimaris TaxID=571298 RepID=A0A1G8YS45_9RHOB|nr:histidine phosphatase family protein [Aliiruegeria lutimaris]SDK05662.1 probable phosphoglycerate mutase [Aliiruegeria lutimaris]
MFILRHGETVWNVEGRMQGGLVSPLTERGRAQALRQGEILRRAGAEGLPVYSSPQGRALETARLAMPGAALIEDQRLAEIDMGAWQGLTYGEIRRVSPEIPAAPDSFLWKFAAPGGERLEEMLVRLRDFLSEVPAEAVVVTHGVASQLLRGCTLKLDLAAMAALDDPQGVVHRVTEHGEILLSS